MFCQFEDSEQFEEYYDLAADPHQLDNLQEDQGHLLDVWTKLAEIWKTIDKIDQTPFQAYTHKAVKEGLD